ncbi:MAG: Kelch repeat-containing protein, partial [Promethearchaeota archaeon]
GRRSAFTWIDSKDNLWLFGGLGFAESGERAYLNDLWKYNGSDWTWVSGHKWSRIFGNYGIKSVPDLANYPGSRGYGVSWIDSNDNLWLFGGYGFPASGIEAFRLNDLWKYDGTSWTWMSGSTTINIDGEYGLKGIPTINNCPGSRDSSISWIDSNDNLWLFGGYGYSEHTTDWHGMLLNDLWKFDPDLRNIRIWI